MTSTQALSSKKTSRRRAKGSSLPRLVIEGIQPQLQAGRYAVKRMVGDTVLVGADIYKDGHDQIAARLCYRAPGERKWQTMPLNYDYNEDRWSGSFVVDRIGRWSFTVEAWTDVYGSWSHDLEKKFAAGQDVSTDIAEGAAIIEPLVRRLKGQQRSTLRGFLERLKSGAEHAEIVESALSPELQTLICAHEDRNSLTRFPIELPIWVDRERAGFAAWYEFFPRSQGSVPGKHATFADAERRLPELAELGFDVLYLPPIHPIGETNRKGPNNTLEARPGDPGCPWAIGSKAGGHTAVEPALGTIEDFEHFVEKANSLGMEVALDYALQCAPDHPWAREHPEWFFIRPDGSIKYAENPPKKYEDIYPLNFWCDDREALWEECKQLFRFWISKGVRTFRVDNPHTKPLAFWEWVIHEIHEENPDIVFLSEAFTRPKRMKGLAKLGFTQSYTYFTWRNSAAELRQYLTELTTTEMKEYFRANFFANTPDILHAYLQEGGRPAFRIRLLLAATLSPIYGIYSGFELCENIPRHPGSEEYLDSDKYQVRVRDWDAPGNIKDDISAINRIRRENSALRGYDNLTFHDSDYDGILFYRKSSPGNVLLIIVNLDPHFVHETMVHVPLADLGIGENEPFEVHDLLSGSRYTWRGTANYVRLDPGFQVGHILRVHKLS